MLNACVHTAKLDCLSWPTRWQCSLPFVVHDEVSVGLGGQEHEIDFCLFLSKASTELPTALVLCAAGTCQNFVYCFLCDTQLLYLLCVRSLRTSHPICLPEKHSSVPGMMYFEVYLKDTRATVLLGLYE